MRTSRRLFALLVAICMILPCFAKIPVTAGAADSFDSLVVEFPNYIVYNRSNRPAVTIYDGQTKLRLKEDYSVLYSRYSDVTDSATATITGLGKYAGFQKTYTYTIVKKDLSGYTLKVSDKDFTGAPITPYAFYYESADDISPVQDIEKIVCAEQNVNVGQGFARTIGIENHYGSHTGNFNIQLRTSSDITSLPGHYMGQYGGTLDNQTLVTEMWLAPGTFNGHINSSGRSQAYYELAKVDRQTGETELVTSYTTDIGFGIDTDFNYDFSSVYNDNTEEGFTTYILAYVWMKENGDMYSGALILYIPNKVPDATTIQLEQIEGDGDFRHDYLTVYSEDGALEKSTWSISDSSVATVDRGAVTFLKPGTVTVTATCGNLSAKQTLTAEAIAMADTTVLAWEDGKAVLMYDYILLKDGIDFTATAETKNGVITVTATGKGLFEGTITQYFDAKTGQPTDAPEISTIPGDLNNDALVNNDDVVLLMWHNLFPENYPINVPADLTGDGSVNNDDVVLLMWHNLFPEDYPI